jgi:hypothetical protein
MPSWVYTFQDNVTIITWDPAVLAVHPKYVSKRSYVHNADIANTYVVSATMPGLHAGAKMYVSISSTHNCCDTNVML